MNITILIAIGAAFLCAVVTFVVINKKDNKK